MKLRAGGGDLEPLSGGPEADARFGFDEQMQGTRIRIRDRRMSGRGMRAPNPAPASLSRAQLSSHFLSSAEIWRCFGLSSRTIT